MPRFQVRLPIALVAQADTAALTLTADGLISRNRELVKANPMVAIALARIISQVVYRIASERYREEGREVILTIELTREELDAIKAFASNIIFNINAAIRYYENLLKEGRARNKSAVEARIAALKIWQRIVTQLAEAD